MNRALLVFTTCWITAFLPGQRTEAEPPPQTGASRHADPRLDADAFTVVVEFRLRNLHEPQWIAGRGARGELFTLYLYKGRVRMLVAHDAPEYSWAALSPPQPGEWTTLLGSYDGETIRLESDRHLSSRRAEGRLEHSDLPLWIGSRAGGADRLHGEIRRFRLWNRALSPEQRIAAKAGDDVAEAALVVDVRPAPEPPPEPFLLPAADGYRGIWYSNQPTGDQHGFKYSGGFGTYPQQHVPIAIHDAAAGKTWFALGARGFRGSLEHHIACLDHETFTVSAPRILLDKRTTDAHDNPTLALDPAGHLLVFSNSHGTARPSFVHRSLAPHDHRRFVRTWIGNFSYGQPWWLGGPTGGLVLLHTRYQGGRRVLHLARGAGGTLDESTIQPLAAMDRGHYQVSWSDGDSRLATAFNRHPTDGGLNARTDLHYVETRDAGQSWQTVDGTPVELPLTDPAGPSLVHPFAKDGQLVYLKDIAFAQDGRPILLFVTSSSWRPGPAGGPRRLQTARHDGATWQIRPGPEVDHNYDHGSLLIDPDGGWRLIAPTGPGPQPWLTGGAIESWRSEDAGTTWSKTAVLTPNPRRHHTYVRKVVNAHPDCEVVWADGDPLQRSASAFHFAARDGRVFTLPTDIGSNPVRPRVSRH